MSSKHYYNFSETDDKRREEAYRLLEITYLHSMLIELMYLNRTITEEEYKEHREKNSETIEELMAVIRAD